MAQWGQMNLLCKPDDFFLRTEPMVKERIDY